MTQPLKIILLDDEPKMGRILSRILGREGHEADPFDDPAAAFAALEKGGPENGGYDLLITDMKMPTMDGMEVLQRARATAPGLDVVMMTAYATAETAVRAMKEGAFDYLIKPFPNEELIMVVARVAERRHLREENESLKQSLVPKFEPDNIVAASPAMRDVLKRVEKVAASDVSVLLRGESGTGKEVLATAIHAAGPRSAKPLVTINCGALPETLLESELFGHTRGAFTGAIETRKGLFQQADKGTIFLDEIGEVTPALQVKLLRVLQSGEFQRVGDAQTFHVDVRVLAATNRDLESMIESGQFRADLYYRLNVVPIVIPPLRARTGDIPALIDHFLARLRRRSGKPVKLAPEAYALLERYPWPGNIRELENALEHAHVMCEEGTIQAADLPVAVQNAAMGGGPRMGIGNGSMNGGAGAVRMPIISNTTMHEGNGAAAENPRTLEAMERRALLEALEATGFNHTRAAMKLGITRRTLGYRLEKYGIPRRDPSRAPAAQGDGEHESAMQDGASNGPAAEGQSHE